MNILKTYFQQSRSPLYSLLMALPILLAYEILIFTFNHSDIVGLRNGADVIFKQIFALFNIYGLYSVGFLLLLVLLLLTLFADRAKRQPLRPQFFLLMVLESLGYALLLYSLLHYFELHLLSAAPVANDRKWQIALALGAGVYEEFIFRVILVSGFLFGAREILRLHPITAGILALILSAGLFTAFHYLGPYGESFNLRSGLFRMAAGTLLGLIYIIRGYGITAYTHTFYDLLLVFG